MVCEDCIKLFVQLLFVGLITYYKYLQSHIIGIEFCYIYWQMVDDDK